MRLEPGVYAHCIEDDSFTPMDDENDDSACMRCTESGADDPFITQVERVTPCPSPDPDDCDSDIHHYGTGMHHEDVEL